MATGSTVASTTLPSGVKTPPFKLKVQPGYLVYPAKKWFISSLLSNSDLKQLINILLSELGQFVYLSLLFTSPLILLDGLSLFSTKSSKRYMTIHKDNKTPSVPGPGAYK